MSENFRKYSASGALFQKTNLKIDYSGQLEISDEVFADLVKQFKENKDKPDGQKPWIKMSLVGWRKKGKNGNFLSIVANKYEEYNPKPKKIEETTNNDVKSDELPDDINDIM